MGMMQRKRGDRNGRTIEFMLYRQKEIERAIKIARIEEQSGHSGGNNTGHALISDPTATQGIKAAMELKRVILEDGDIIEWPERWIQVIDATYRHADKWERMVLKARYIHKEYAPTTWKRLHIGKSLYYTMRDNSLTFAEKAACQLGLLKVIYNK